MPEPTRQSVSGCCPQPKHGPTLATKCHRGVKEERSPTGSLANLANTLPLSYRVTRLVTFPPCLIRFVPESARNHVGTDEPVSLLLAARARTLTDPQNVTGAEKRTMRALYHFKLMSHTIDRLHFPPAQLDSSSNLLGTMPEPRDNMFQFAPRRPGTDPHLPPNVTEAEKEHARPVLEPRVSHLPCEHSTTELPSDTIDWFRADSGTNQLSRGEM